MNRIPGIVPRELLLLILPVAAVWLGVGWGFGRLGGLDFSSVHFGDAVPGFLGAYVVSRAIALPLQLEKRAWWSILSYAGLLLVIFILVAFSVASAFAA